jgi:hypothetical protein
VEVTADPRRQWSSYRRFTRQDWVSVWEPEKVRVERPDGSQVHERADPFSSFAGHTLETPWDELHLAYFSGYAIWNYLTLPFIFAWPGFSTEEIGETTHDGERRRKLKVLFPEGFATHCREQIFFVDDAGLVRRQDYAAVVAGAARTAHFLDDHKRFGGLTFWTKRRAVRRTADDRPIPDVVVVGIDVSDIRLS